MQDDEFAIWDMSDDGGPVERIEEGGFRFRDKGIDVYCGVDGGDVLNICAEEDHMKPYIYHGSMLHGSYDFWEAQCPNWAHCQIAKFINTCVSSERSGDMIKLYTKLIKPPSEEGYQRSRSELLAHYRHKRNWLLVASDLNGTAMKFVLRPHTQTTS